METFHIFRLGGIITLDLKKYENENTIFCSLFVHPL